MQFTADNAAKVMSGRKTQTRRPVKSGDTTTRNGNGEIVAVDRIRKSKNVHRQSRSLKWYVGQDQAVQPGRGKHAIGRMCITNIRREAVGDISEADAIAEGCDSVQEFIDIWKSLHGRWTPEDEVWVLDFAVVSTG